MGIDAPKEIPVHCLEKLKEIEIPIHLLEKLETVKDE